MNSMVHMCTSPPRIAKCGCACALHIVHCTSPPWPELISFPDAKLLVSANECSTTFLHIFYTNAAQFQHRYCTSPLWHKSNTSSVYSHMVHTWPKHHFPKQLVNIWWSSSVSSSILYINRIINAMGCLNFGSLVFCLKNGLPIQKDHPPLCLLT